MDDGDGHRPLRLELAVLGQELDHRLGDRDLSIGIERSLRRGAGSPRRFPRRRAVVVLIIGLVSLLAIPPARAAITDFLSVGAIRIEPTGTPPPTTAAAAPSPAPSAHLSASLGDARTLAEVREEMPVVVPTTDELGAPDQIRFESSNGRHASLLYRARPGLPALPHTDGIGLLIEEFVGDGRTMVRKYRSDRTIAEPVDINGNPGVYLNGGPHLAFYEDASGHDIQAEGRTVGEALVFQHGDLTIRIEADLDRDRMVDLARSLEI